MRHLILHQQAKRFLRNFPCDQKKKMIKTSRKRPSTFGRKSVEMTLSTSESKPQVQPYPERHFNTKTETIYGPRFRQTKEVLL